MADAPALISDGFVKVTWVPTIAVQNAPTVAELAAGPNIDLECQITPDGLAREASDDSVDTSRLCSVFTTMQVGRTSFNVSLTLVRLSGTDEAYATLLKGTVGFIVIRDTLPVGTAYAAAQKVQVYPVQLGTQSDATPAANEMQKFVLPMFVTADPSLKAVVAA